MKKGKRGIENRKTTNDKPSSVGYEKRRLAPRKERNGPTKTI